MDNVSCDQTSFELVSTSLISVIIWSKAVTGDWDEGRAAIWVWPEVVCRFLRLPRVGWPHSWKTWLKCERNNWMNTWIKLIHCLWFKKASICLYRVEMSLNLKIHWPIKTDLNGCNHKDYRNSLDFVWTLVYHCCYLVICYKSFLRMKLQLNPVNMGLVGLEKSIHINQKFMLTESEETSHVLVNLC